MKKLSKKVRMAQRVEICKDVIAQLRAGQYRAKANYGYLYAGELRVFDNLRARSGSISVDAQEVVNKILGPECKLCQRGGLLLSAIRKFDDLQLTYRSQLHDEAMGRSNYAMYLQRWFTDDELSELEAVFEGDSEDNPDYDRWQEVYDDATDRMDAIMRNVVAHDGEFVPTDIPRPRRKPLSEILRGVR